MPMLIRSSDTDAGKHGNKHGPQAARRSMMNVFSRPRHNSKDVLYSLDGEAVPAYTIEVQTDEVGSVVGGNPSSKSTRFEGSVVEDFNSVPFRYDRENEHNAINSTPKKVKEPKPQPPPDVAATPVKKTRVATPETDLLTCQEEACFEVTEEGILGEEPKDDGSTLPTSSVQHDLSSRVSSRGSAVELLPAFEACKISDNDDRSVAKCTPKALHGDQLSTRVDSRVGAVEIYPEANYIADGKPRRVVPDIRRTKSADALGTTVSLDSDASGGVDEILDGSSEELDEVDAIMLDLRQQKRLGSRPKRHASLDDRAVNNMSRSDSAGVSSLSAVFHAPIDDGSEIVGHSSRSRRGRNRDHGKEPVRPTIHARRSLTTDYNNSYSHEEQMESIEELHEFLDDHYYRSSSISKRIPTGFEGCFIQNLINLANWIDGDEDDIAAALAAQRSFGSQSSAADSFFPEEQIHRFHSRIESPSTLSPRKGMPPRPPSRTKPHSK